MTIFFRFDFYFIFIKLENTLGNFDTPLNNATRLALHCHATSNRDIASRNTLFFYLPPRRYALWETPTTLTTINSRTIQKMEKFPLSYAEIRTKKGQICRKNRSPLRVECPTKSRNVTNTVTTKLEKFQSNNNKFNNLTKLHLFQLRSWEYVQNVHMS